MEFLEFFLIRLWKLEKWGITKNLNNKKLWHIKKLARDQFSNRKGKNMKMLSHIKNYLSHASWGILWYLPELLTSLTDLSKFILWKNWQARRIMRTRSCAKQLLSVRFESILFNFKIKYAVNRVIVRLNFFPIKSKTFILYSYYLIRLY